MLETVSTPSQRTIVLEVNQSPIYGDEIRARTAELRARAEQEYGELSIDQRFDLRNQAIHDLVERTLIHQEARRLKLAPTDAEIDATLVSVAPKVDGSEGCRADVADPESRLDIERRVMIDRLLERWLGAVRPPKSTELKEYYAKHKEEFWMPDSIEASHIVKHVPPEDPGDAAREAVAEIRAAIVAGEPFAEAAKRASDCPERAGSLGYFPRGVMVDEFDAVAFETPVGQVSEPFRTGFGWHIVYVTDKKPEGVAPYEDVVEQIRERLVRQKQEEAVGSKLDALHKRAKIVEVTPA